MAFLVATNVVASRPLKCRPTGTPHDRAKMTFHTPPSTTNTIPHTQTPYQLLLAGFGLTLILGFLVHPQ